MIKKRPGKIIEAKPFFVDFLLTIMPAPSPDDLTGFEKDFCGGVFWDQVTFRH